jgi:nucleoid DNA-binding protein
VGVKEIFNLKIEVMKATEKEKKVLYLIAQGMTKAELIDAIASGSKLTKADAGRLIASLPKKEIIKFLFGVDKTVLIDAIAASAKLTKADAGRALDATIEQIKKLKVVFGGKGA